MSDLKCGCKGCSHDAVIVVKWQNERSVSLCDECKMELHAQLAYGFVKDMECFVNSVPVDDERVEFDPDEGASDVESDGVDEEE